MDVTQALGDALRVIAAGKTLTASTRRLLALCRREEPENPTWSKLAKLDVAADANRIRDALAQALPFIGSKYTGLYFGLDGLNMANGKGVEFGCSTRHRTGGDDGEWPYHCDLYPGEIPSRVLSRAYDEIEVASLGDYLFCLGYLGLVLRRAFEQIDPEVALGKATERAIVFGFHDGDLIRLGLITRKGFRQRFDRWAQSQIERARHRVPSSQSRRAPKRAKGNQHEPTYWMRTASENAFAIGDARERDQILIDVAMRTQSFARQPGVADFVNELVSSVAPVLSPTRLPEFFQVLAWTYHDAGRSDLARALLKRAHGASTDDLRHLAWHMGDFETWLRLAPAGRSFDIDRPVAEAEAALRAGDQQSCRGHLRAVQNALDRANKADKEDFRAAQYQLFWQYVAAREFKHAAKLLGKVNDAPADILAKVLWQAGDANASRRTILRAVEAELDDADEPVFYSHHKMSVLRRLLDEPQKYGDAKGFAQGVGRILQYVRRSAFSTDWVASLVFADLAVLLSQAGAAERAAEAFTVASDAADQGPKSNATMCWGKLSEAYTEIQQWDAALTAAKRISPRYRVSATARILFRAGQIEKASILFDRVKSAKERAELAMAFLESMRPAD